MEKARVLFLITGLERAGAETQVVQLAKRLSYRGWRVALVSITPPKDFVSELEEAGISVSSLDVRSKSEAFRAIRRLIHMLRSFQPHILHSHMVHANLLARLVRSFASIPVLICTAHSIDERGRKGSGKLRVFLYRITDHLCDLTTQVSRAGLERYVRIRAAPRHKIRHIPNGVDIERFSPNPELRARVRKELNIGSEFVWLAVGRFAPQKDYATMLHAFARVVKEYPDTSLLIAGDGPLRPFIETLAIQLGINKRVSFLGICENIPELMNAADGYIMSSYWEGMPMVLLEAHAVGLPVVATNVGGNREIVLNGKTGFLVPPKNSGALAQAMSQLMKLPEEERQRMGHEGRKYIMENFSLERVVDLWEALYRELLDRKGIKVE